MSVTTLVPFAFSSTRVMTIHYLAPKRYYQKKISESLGSARLGGMLEYRVLLRINSWRCGSVVEFLPKHTWGLGFDCQHCQKEKRQCSEWIWAMHPNPSAWEAEVGGSWVRGHSKLQVNLGCTEEYELGYVWWGVLCSFDFFRGKQKSGRQCVQLVSIWYKWLIMTCDMFSISSGIPSFGWGFWGGWGALKPAFLAGSRVTCEKSLTVWDWDGRGVKLGKCFLLPVPTSYSSEQAPKKDGSHTHWKPGACKLALWSRRRHHCVVLCVLLQRVWLAWWEAVSSLLWTLSGQTG